MMPSSAPQKQEFDLKSYLRMFNRRKWFGIIPMVIIMILTVLYVRELPEVYRSFSEISVQSDGVVNPFGRRNFSGHEQNRIEKRFAYVEGTILHWDSIMYVCEKVGFDRTILVDAELPIKIMGRRILELVGLTSSDTSKEAARREQFYNALRKKLEVKKTSNPNVVNIAYTGRSSGLNKQIVNFAVTGFLERNQQRFLTSSMNSEDVYGDFLKDYQDKLDAAKVKLDNYKQKYPELTSDRANSPQYRKLNDLNDRISQTEAERIVSRKLKSTREAQLAETEEEIPEEIEEKSTPTLAHLESQLRAEEARLIRFKADLHDTHPSVRSSEDTIEAIKKQIDEEKKQLKTTITYKKNPVYLGLVRAIERLNTEIEAKEIQIETWTSQHENLQASLLGGATQEQESELRKLERDVEKFESMNAVFQTGLDRATVEREIMQTDKAQNEDLFSLLTNARVSEIPIDRLHLKEGGMGLLAAIAAGLGIILLLEFLDQSIKSVKQAREFLGQYPCLGVIPELTVPGPQKKRRKVLWFGGAAGILLLAIAIGFIVLRN